MNSTRRPSPAALRGVVFGFSLLVLAFGVLTTAANTTGVFLLRNLMPAALAWVLLLWVVMRHAGDARWWLGWIGFLVPTLGLSGYLHLAFLNDWDGLATQAVTPDQFFRYLPIFALFAGGIGFAIGRIVGGAMQRTARKT